ncbi:MAG: ferrochelatase [Cocleimonas sp.]
MAKVKSDKTFFHGKAPITGVLLTNLGTPAEATPPAVRKFLKQFLSDGRVIEIPKIIWWIILNAFILPKRPKESAANYAKVWMDEGSPLMHYSQQQQKLLQKEMQVRFNGPVHIELAMRYGDPSIESALDALQAKGARRILILPLYPQYSATTTATTFDSVYKHYMGKRWIPELRFVGQYHDDPSYINSIAKSIETYWKKNGKNDVLLMSFHGLPERNVELGDPYSCHCHKTGRLIAEKLGLEESQWRLTFQSRFGKAEWVKPYTDKTLMGLPGEGVKTIDVVCPGFPSDCVETLEEMNMENREYFMEAGGEKYHLIPCMNDHPDHIQALADLVQLHTQGWTETATDWTVAEAEKQCGISKQRALEKGAKM